MNYRVKQGSVIVAIQQDGVSVAKTVTKEKVYQDAQHDEAGWYSFKVKPGSLYAEFRVLDKDVEVSSGIQSIPDGTYTVVFVEESNYVTIKLETNTNEKTEDEKPNFFFNKQIISYLSGPDNVNNFTGFAHLNESGGLHIWKRFKGDGAIAKYEQALVILNEIGAQGRTEAGLEYAMRSGRCCKCNRELTVPASLHRGMGPVCSQGGTDAA